MTIRGEDVVQCEGCHSVVYKDEAVRIRDSDKWKCIMCVEEDELLYRQRQSQDVEKRPGRKQ